ncbi:MAG TPA: hypothetical protein PK239_15535 [Chitinophagales bacterium]|nr:hypothetical protein [Chitinophagales bacterium]HRK28685.1 hypothetical protein [Chitinophagales bacterium]
MKQFLSFLCLIFTVHYAQAQYEMVVFEYEKNYFNQGNPLPAESFIMLSGQVDQGIDMVKVELYKGGSSKRKKALYENTWKRSYSNIGEKFDLPLNYKLHGGEQYDVVMKNYRSANETEKMNLRQIINSTLDAYVDGIISVERRKLNIAKPAGAIIKDLNGIVQQGTAFYENKINFEFPGFSDIIKIKIEQLNKTKLRRGNIVFASGDKKMKRTETKRLMSEKLITELKTALHTEIEQYINTNLLVLHDWTEVNNYPTEKTRNILSINAGYGGVYFDGDVNNLSYDSAPYVGLSFPFGKSAFSSQFWSKTSFSLGAFVTNFEDEDGNVVTGPIFGRPYYVALGYKVFKFIRINAGATFLEKQRTEFGFNVNDVRIRPFVGVSAELNLWLGLGDKGK